MSILPIDSQTASSPENRCTLFPKSFEIDHLPDSRHFFQNNDAGESTQRLKKRHQAPSPLPLPVKQASIESPSKRQGISLCKSRNPWIDYQKFKDSGIPGKTCLAILNSSPGRIVAIKEYRSGGIDRTRYLIRTSNKNIVNLIDIFSEAKIFYFVYELMEVSLRQLHSGITLKDTEIAFICKEVSQNKSNQKYR